MLFLAIIQRWISRICIYVNFFQRQTPYDLGTMDMIITMAENEITTMESTAG
jgi:hypothetical protein